MSEDETKHKPQKGYIPSGLRMVMRMNCNGMDTAGVNGAMI